MAAGYKDIDNNLGLGSFDLIVKKARDPWEGGFDQRIDTQIIIKLWGS